MASSRRIAIALATATLLAVGATGLFGATHWIGRSFPGFLVLANGVVASAGLPDWPATAGGRIYQHQIVAVQGEPFVGVAELQRQIEAQPPGTPVRYRLRDAAGRESRQTILTRRFGAQDFLLLFGIYLLNGGVLGAAALGVLWLGRRDPLGSGTFPLLFSAALWALSALDLYGPFRLFRLHALAEVLLFPAALHMALRFPRPTRLGCNPRVLIALYGVAGLLAGVYQVGLMRPALYVPVHLMATSAFGGGLLALVVSQVGRYFWPAAPEVRSRIRVLALGAVVALAPAVALTLAEAFSGGSAPQNTIGFTAFVFPLCVAWAAVREKAACVAVRA